MTGLHFAIEKTWSARKPESRLCDVVARLSFDFLAELLPLLLRAVWADQHAVAAGLAHRFNDQLIHMFKHVAALRFVAEQIGLHVREDGVFSQVVMDDGGYVGVDSLIVGNAGADRVGQRHVASAVGVEQSWHAQT